MKKTVLRTKSKYEDEVWRIVKLKEELGATTHKALSFFSVGDIASAYTVAHPGVIKANVKMAIVTIFRKWAAEGRIRFVKQEAGNSPIPKKMYEVISND